MCKLRSPAPAATSTTAPAASATPLAFFALRSPDRDALGEIGHLLAVLPQQAHPLSPPAHLLEVLERHAAVRVPLGQHDAVGAQPPLHVPVAQTGLDVHEHQELGIGAHAADDFGLSVPLLLFGGGRCLVASVVNLGLLRPFAASSGRRVTVLGQTGAEVDVSATHLLEAAALDNGRPEGEVGAVDDDDGHVGGLERDGRVQGLARQLDAVALVGADEPVLGVRRVGVALRDGLQGETLLGVVPFDLLDLGQGRLEGADPWPLELDSWLGLEVTKGKPGACFGMFKSPDEVKENLQLDPTEHSPRRSSRYQPRWPYASTGPRAPC